MVVDNASMIITTSVRRGIVLCGGMKGTCKHVSTPTIKSVMEQREKV